MKKGLCNNLDVIIKFVIINIFNLGKTHMVIVRKPYHDSFNVTGIVTLEDIIEEILQTEIADEADYLKNDNRSKSH